MHTYRHACRHTYVRTYMLACLKTHPTHIYTCIECSMRLAHCPTWPWIIYSSRPAKKNPTLQTNVYTIDYLKCLNQTDTHAHNWTNLHSKYHGLCSTCLCCLLLVIRPVPFANLIRTGIHSRPPWRRWVEGVAKIALGSDPLPSRDLYL